MPKSLTASDRSSLIKLAHSLEKGSDERKAILAGLKSSRADAITLSGGRLTLVKKGPKGVGDDKAVLTEKGMSNGARVKVPLSGWPASSLPTFHYKGDQVDPGKLFLNQLAAFVKKDSSPAKLHTQIQRYFEQEAGKAGWWFTGTMFSG